MMDKFFKIFNYLLPLKKKAVVEKTVSIDINDPGKKSDKIYILTLASFNRRLLASAIDLLILVLTLSVMNIFLNSALFPSDQVNEFSLSMALSDHENSFIAENLRLMQKHKLLIPYIMSQIISILVVSAFLLIYWLKYAATPGQILCKCRIISLNKYSREYNAEYFRQYVDNIDINQGNMTYKLDKRTSIKRLIGLLINGCTLGLGFFLINFTEKNQALHDFIAATVVTVVDNKITTSVDKA